jgi:glycine/D-amino acid oxidase-like deaminating enzyme
MNVMTERREVIVVGGDRAGLAIGYFLAEQGPPLKTATARRAYPC